LWPPSAALEDEMSVYSDSYNQQTGGSAPGCRTDWKPVEIVAMVLGFVVFWPIGLAILFAKMWQRKSAHQGDIPAFLEAKFREKFGDDWQSKWDRWEAKMGRHWSCGSRADFGSRAWGAGSWGMRSSGNLAFDEWRETELSRLEEERQKLVAAEREFTSYMENLRRAKDREEFDRFMNARRNGGTEPPQPTA
jgi:hypothetical protein